MTTPKWYIIIVSIIVGIVIQYMTWQAAYYQGKVIGEVPFVLFQERFFIAAQKKEPMVFKVYGEKWQLVFHSHEKDVYVTKVRPKKIKRPLRVEFKVNKDMP